MNYRQLIVSFFLLVFLLVPTSAKAQSIGNEAIYRSLLLELIANLQLQIKLLQLQLELEQTRQIESSEADLEGYVDVIYSYKINQPEEVSQIKNLAQRKYFAEVFKVFPTEYDELIKELIVFAPESSDFDAFVQTMPPKHESWLYAVNEEIIEDTTSIENTELIVHELAHIVSYEAAANLTTSISSNCEPYFENHGCPAADSYLRKYVDIFWSKADLERADDLVGNDDLFTVIDKYYERHQTEFVSNYAATSPEEDFSESFMFFVLDKAVPVNTKAEAKVDFFNRFSKFLQIKAEVNNNL